MEATDAKNQLHKCKVEDKNSSGYKASIAAGQICGCEDELDIFERFVQDPCMDAWEGLDEEEDRSQWEDEELDPVCEGVEGFGQKAAKTGKANICSNCHRLRRWKTAATSQDPEEPVLRCSRTNSFMSQLSRQASRQSLPDAGESTCTSPVQLASPTQPSGQSLEIGPSYTRPVSRSRSRSRSSFGATSAIPAHIYCLERFVSCELDSNAECFFKNEVSPHPTDSSATSTLGSPGASDPATSPHLSGALSSASSSNSAKALSDVQPLFLNKRKSRVSSIEVSLLNSFS